MERVLLLNNTFEPIKVLDWKKAVTLLTLGKVEVVEEYDREVRTVSFSIRLPSIVRLLKFVRIKKKKEVYFSRQNIFIRDNFSCQYCGGKLKQQELTFDHVVPKFMGGRTTWENIVTACVPCNRKKAGRTPSQAGMRLLRGPAKPRWTPVLRITFHFKNTPESWRDYLYWNTQLEN
ncbi:MAG: HNH endonuclease [Nitrospinae bacterium]|nr:HNH endonuclease [Nitrospinota bacterium]